jgi:putative hemolysin
VSPVVALPLIGLLLLLEGFFSGSELALVSVDKVTVRAQRDSGGRSIRMLARFFEEPEQILTTTLIGTNVCVVSSTTVFGLMLAGLLGEGADGRTELLTVLCLSPLLLVFAELVPKSVYRRYSDRLAPLVIHPLTWLSYALFPIVGLVRGLTTTMLAMLGVQDRGMMAISRDELRLLLERGEGEEIEVEERRMIRRIFDFPEVTAKEVMVPLIDIDALPETATLKEAADKFLETGHSRLPVFHERVDDITGVLHAMDVLAEDKPDRPVCELAKPVSYVPPTQKVERLMDSLQRNRYGIAVVVDEYGGAEGMITVEDILEEIVGEIEDEHDEREQEILQRADGEFLVSARAEVDHLNEELDVEIPEGDYETVGGFLLEWFGRIPRRGDQARTERATLTVVSATDRVIEEIRIVLKEPRERAEE